MERLFQPNHIEGILIAYRNGDTSTQRCRSVKPSRFIIQQKIPDSYRKFFNKIKPNKKNKKEFSTKNNEHDPDCKDRFIVDSVYYDDSDAFLVYFTQESDDICDEATGYLLVCFNNIGKIASIRIASPSKHIRGIASEEPSFTLNPTYDEKRDVFKINFTDSAPMTTFKKTEVEDVELEIDNEGKLVTLLFHNASNKMSNISKTSV
ncbi:3086_t:CDS:2 [Entrophospora sp. SA101]|nr:3086_t:CDS:2 [Entrophospora sp. SA101]